MFLKLNKMKEKILLFFVALAPINAIAHAGHDHSSQWANLIHLLWILPAVISAFIIIKLTKKRIRK